MMLKFFKRACFFGDVPNPESKHIVVVVSDVIDGKAVVVPLSSVKYKSDGTSKYYDKACVFEAGTFLDKDKNFSLNKKSFVRYEWAVEVDLNKIEKNGFKFKCIIVSELFEEIIKGAKISAELEPRFLKFFK